MAIWTPKRTMEADNLAYGVCVWRYPDGSYLMDDQQRHLSSQGRPFDKNIENRMIEVVRKEYGDIKGEPFWLPGFRKITDSEWDDQMENLLDGETPDPVDVVRQLNG